MPRRLNFDDNLNSTPENNGQVGHVTASGGEMEWASAYVYLINLVKKFDEIPADDPVINSALHYIMNQFFSVWTELLDDQEEIRKCAASIVDEVLKQAKEHAEENLPE